MAQKRDYLVKEDFDLVIEDGDFKQGIANDAHSTYIMEAAKGEIRSFVLLGASIQKYIGSSVDEDIIDTAIKDELRKDNLIVTDITTTKELNNINVDLTVE